MPRTLAAALLLLAATLAPELVWAGAHLLPHDDPHHAAEHGSQLAEIVVHGHSHREGTPDHEHDLAPSSPLRPNPAPHLQAPPIASFDAPDPALLRLSSAAAGAGRLGFSGSGPPRLHLLCTLLI